MFEFLTGNPAVSLLKDDHDRVKALFDDFEAAKSRPAKLKIVRAALTELKVHAAIEEELFYPAVRKPIGKEIMNEADEEHHVAKLLIAELDGMDGSESHFDAKFTVLAENVRHHIKEEEDEMLPKAKAAAWISTPLLKKCFAARNDSLPMAFPRWAKRSWSRPPAAKVILPLALQPGSRPNCPRAESGKRVELETDASDQSTRTLAPVRDGS
jgi:hypothetical protein